MNVRLLEVDDVDRYLRLTADIADGSGQGGEAHSHAYSASEPFDVIAMHDDAQRGSNLNELNWEKR